MMELFLEDGFLRFDGEVVELFDDNGTNARYHVRYVTEIKLYEGRKGITLMDLKYGKNGGSGFRGHIVQAENVGQAQQFIQTVQSASQQARMG